MEINLHNYEEFFLLYTDNELDAVQRETVERFVEEHPGLKEELDSLLQTKLPTVFPIMAFDKSVLYKSESVNEPAVPEISEQLMLYIDNELGENERKLVEGLALKNKDVAEELRLLQAVKFSADEVISFPDKSVLYKKEGGAVLVPMWVQWRKLAVAASIIFTAGVLWLNKDAFTTSYSDAVNRVAAVQNPGNKIQKAPDQKIEATTPVKAEKIDENKESDKPELAVVAVKQESNSQGAPINHTKNHPGVHNANVAVENADNAAKTTILAAASVPETAIKVPEVSPIHDVATINAAAESPVKPFKISEAAFTAEDDNQSDPLITTQEGIAFLDTEAKEEKSRSNFRVLIRKTSRLINRNKISENKEDDSVIRIASFAIAKK